MDLKLENFIQAFSSSGCCVRECSCGNTYYFRGGAYDWTRGEVEKLDADPFAQECSETPRTIYLQGREYVSICKCWRPRAEKIMDFLDDHGAEIASYLYLEKGRKSAEVKSSPPAS